MMKPKLGMQINTKAEADLIISAMEAYVKSNPQMRTVVFSDIVKRLSIIQNNLEKIENMQNIVNQQGAMSRQGENQQKNIPRNNPISPAIKSSQRQSTQVQQRNQRVLGQQNLPRR